MSATQAENGIAASTVANFLNELTLRLNNAYETAYEGTSKGDIEVALTTIAEFTHFVGLDELRSAVE